MDGSQHHSLLSCADFCSVSTRYSSPSKYLPIKAAQHIALVRTWIVVLCACFRPAFFVLEMLWCRISSVSDLGVQTCFGNSFRKSLLSSYFRKELPPKSSRVGLMTSYTTNWCSFQICKTMITSKKLRSCLARQCMASEASPKLSSETRELMPDYIVSSVVNSIFLADCCTCAFSWLGFCCIVPHSLRTSSIWADCVMRERSPHKGSRHLGQR